MREHWYEVEAFYKEYGYDTPYSIIRSFPNERTARDYATEVLRLSRVIGKHTSEDLSIISKYVYNGYFTKLGSVYKCKKVKVMRFMDE